MQNILARSISTSERSNWKSRSIPAIRTKKAKSICSNQRFRRAQPSRFSETQTSKLRPATQLLRIVSPALLTYEKGGLLQRKAVPLICSEFDGIDDATKIQVIKYLQGLRLLIWLLKINNFVATNVSELGITSRSSLAVQAALTSWECSTALQGLIDGLSKFMKSDHSLPALILYAMDIWPGPEPKYAVEVLLLSGPIRDRYYEGITSSRILLGLSVSDVRKLKTFLHYYFCIMSGSVSLQGFGWEKAVTFP